MSSQTIAIIGLGYIGLPTAAVIASRGHKVVGVDVSAHVVDTINRGDIHIVEPELGGLVHKAVTDGLLSASTEPQAADAFMVAVPTPFRRQKDGLEPDLSYIESASRSLAPVLKKGDLVVLESTSPVGATEQMAAWLAAERPDLSFPQNAGEASDIRIAHCPERVLPGKVVHELVENDRVIGGMTPRCAEAARRLYQLFVQGECVITTARTAEMAKLTENAFRDVNIAFANELSLICDHLDINVWELVALANRHPRVNILQPGPGVGGHCIAVDPWFIVSQAPEQSRLIRTAREVNDGKPEWVREKVRAAVGQCLQDQPQKRAADIVVACYGLAFKANIDDLRESPALQIARQLASDHPGPLKVVEPNIDALPAGLEEGVLCDFDSALESADVHVLLVDHNPFKGHRPGSGLVVDTRGIWD